jgi:hypothetical protein
MFKRRQRLGRRVLLLAACFCLFTLAQVARPLAHTTLRCRTQIGVKHSKLTRHVSEEVNGQSPTVSPDSALESSDFFPSKATPPRPRVQQADARDWAPGYLPVHRRIPPPAPDDAH